MRDIMLLQPELLPADVEMSVLRVTNAVVPAFYIREQYHLGPLPTNKCLFRVVAIFASV